MLIIRSINCLQLYFIIIHLVFCQKCLGLLQVGQRLFEFIPSYIFYGIVPVHDIFQVIYRHFIIQPLDPFSLTDLNVIIQPLNIFQSRFGIQSFIHELPDNIDTFDKRCISHLHAMNNLFIQGYTFLSQIIGQIKVGKCLIGHLYAFGKIQTGRFFL